MRPLLLALALVAALPVSATPAAAQVRPQPGPGDPRIQSIDYDENQVVQVAAAPGYQVTIQFAPDEVIENVALGDNGAWQATANRRGDHLFLKSLGGASTNMTVVTNTRIYAFDLVPGDQSVMPYTLRFNYPGLSAHATAAVEPGPESEIAPASRYRIGGARSLRPSMIRDDGTHTYVEWPRDRSLPAVYALDDRGQETLVNGAMREDRFVIDGIAERLVFRIDRQTAWATRQIVRRR